MTKKDEITVIADIGARYGIHPSWNGFEAPLHYIAFEPDPSEAERLREAYKETSCFRYEVQEKALDNRDAIRDFYLLRHRGLSSFLKPDLNSECFKHLKPGQADIEKVIPIKTERLDSVFNTSNLKPDFLKVDTEGTEQDVIEGAETLLKENVLGIRSSCNFQPCFINQKLFSQTHDYLLNLGFFLLNLDYKGFGYPRLGLFRKPDPIENEDYRYGVLVAADAVWIIKPSILLERNLTDFQKVISIFKLSYFCLLNNAPDYGIDLLRELADNKEITEDFRQLCLYKSVRLKVARFLGRFRTVPDQYWLQAQNLYQKIFLDELQGGSYFYPQITEMIKDLNKQKSMM